MAPTTPLDEFSRELAVRFPDRIIMRFIMPPRIRAVREVFIRELTSRDEIEAAILADALMSDVERRSMKLTIEAERRECVRLSVVGIGRAAAGGAVTYEHANTDGIPFSALNSWNLATWGALSSFFGEVNGIPTSEVDVGLKGAQTVGAFAPPTSATPASADPGRSGGASGATT